jgi:hypothetical protein
MRPPVKCEWFFDPGETTGIAFHSPPSTVSSGTWDSKWPFIGPVLQGERLAKNVSNLGQTAGEPIRYCFNSLLACRVSDMKEGRCCRCIFPTVLDRQAMPRAF